MYRIYNQTPRNIFITDAHLCLEPGGCRVVETLTPETQQCVDRRLIKAINLDVVQDILSTPECHDVPPESDSVGVSQTPAELSHGVSETPAPPESPIKNMRPKEAIDFVKSSNDIDVLKACVSQERRTPVYRALTARIMALTKHAGI